MATSEHYFTSLYADDDPFGYRDRWYEARKRELLLACLPHPRFATAWEIGCSNGELTARLAERCGHILATDLSARAVALATARNAAHANVHVEQSTHPEQWPDGRYDLIILSEVGYYLDPADLTRCARGIRSSLDPLGTVVACHWRQPFEQAVQTAEAVHALLNQELGMSTLLLYRDDDILLEAWTPHGRSVAQWEGLA
ncbi:MAG: class I SAM-dependent methyltransferase [Dyella sp.]